MDSPIEVLASENSAIEYLYSKNVMTENRKCRRCRKDMVIEKYRGLFHCPNRKCLKQKSIISKTFFDNSKIRVNKVLHISYLFLIGTPVVGIIEITGLSSATVTEWTRFIRQILADSVDFSDTVIGGNEIVVEVHETKLGKRKYRKVHRVEGYGLLLADRTEDKNV
ncbi:hypothetical protein RF11_01995 [Thelohanellus kitauei]|uniref:Uncharacterized protein n=1 Tax=Thelohanellus kitauei TaxID=669202 RepID=A0A0C2IRD4_THEKT|nr:hypothetical protein RF11_01995 [Thelohanellus kitauei]